MCVMQVMHEFPVVSSDAATATTSRKDFVRHDVMAMARQRMDALNTNRVSLPYPWLVKLGQGSCSHLCNVCD